MNYGKCTNSSNDPIIVVKENKSRLEARNPGRISVDKIQVDGCLVSDGRERCDWILAVESKNKAFFVELKGSDIDKAISQLRSTLTYTSEKFKDYQRECYAVTTRIPKFGPSIQKKCKRFFTETKSTLAVKNRNFNLEI